MCCLYKDFKILVIYYQEKMYFRLSKKDENLSYFIEPTVHNVSRKHHEKISKEFLITLP